MGVTHATQIIGQALGPAGWDGPAPWDSVGRQGYVRVVLGNLPASPVHLYFSLTGCGGGHLKT